MPSGGLTTTIGPCQREPEEAGEHHTTTHQEKSNRTAALTDGGEAMTTAIIGVGNLGKALARHLVNGGEPVVLAARDAADATAVADELGPRATAASIRKAIDTADTVILAVWLDAIREVIADHGAALSGKVVIDPSNPVAFNDKGEVSRTLPDGVSAASVISGLLPEDAHYVKAFGTIAATSMAAEANRSPRKATL